MVSSPSARRWPGRPTFIVGLVGTAMFAVYGSLVPFNLTRVPWDEAVQRFAIAMAEPLELVSRSDVIANVLLMVPVAFCLMSVFRLDRRGLIATLAASVITIAFGYGFASLLEFMQVFTKDRIVSRSDVLAQTMGAAVGVGTWLFAGQPAIDWLRGVGHARYAALDEHWRRVQALLALYAAGWLMLMALPLELTISPADLAHKLRDGGIVLVPFGAQYDSFADGVWDVIGGALSAAPLGVLAWLTALDRRWRTPRLEGILLGSAFVAFGEFVQVFKIHRVADVTDVMSGSAGVAIAVWLAARHLRVATLTSPDARAVSASRGSSWAALGQTLAWCAVLVFYHWKPFDFTTDAHLIRERISDLSLIPLVQYIRASTGPQLLEQILIKSALGLPLGALLARWTNTWGLTGPSGKRLSWLVGLTLSLAVLGGIEVGQIFLPDRFADITDVLVAWCGAAAGMAFVLHGPLAIQQPRQPSSQTARRGRAETQGRRVRTVHETRSL